MNILLYGKENYLVFQRYQKYKQEFQKKYPDAVFEIFDLELDTEIEQIAKSIESGVGLFSQKKCLVLKNVFSASAANQKKLHKLIKEKAKDQEKTLVMIFVQLQKGKMEGSFGAYLKKKSKTEKFDKFGKRETGSFVLEMFSDFSKGQVSVSAEAAELLVASTDGDMWMLENEVKKCVNYVGSGEADLEVVRKICHGKVQAGIFQFVDAVGAGDKARAIELKNDLLSTGENEFFIFSMIISQFRNIIKIKSCLKKGIHDQKQISKRCDIHPFVVSKLFSKIGLYENAQLKKVFALAAKIDQRAKTGELNMSEALDYFIIKV